jgi:hypothetical protein
VLAGGALWHLQKFLLGKLNLFNIFITISDRSEKLKKNPVWENNVTGQDEIVKVDLNKSVFISLEDESQWRATLHK